MRSTHANCWRTRGSSGVTLLVASLAFLCRTTTGARATTKPREPSSIEHHNAEMEVLQQFIGPWRVTEHHFDSRGRLVATVEGTEEVSWILDQHAIRRIYATGSGEDVFRALGTLTWNDVAKKYHGVWFDNVSKGGPTIVEGRWTPDTQTMVFTLESFGESGSTVRHKVVERVVDEKRRTATTFLLTADGVVKRMELEYVRAIPCPDRIRPIFEPDVPRKGKDKRE